MRGLNSFMYMMNYRDPLGIMGAIYGVIVFFSVIAIILGLAQLLWGYKLLRFWIAVQGFCIGGSVGSFIAIFGFFRLGGGVAVVMGLMMILICAAAGAFLAYTFYKVGVFLQCFSCGFLIAVVLFGVLFRFMGLAMVLGCIAGAALGVLGVLLTKPMFIIATSVTGGLNCGMALGTIFGNPVIGIIPGLALICLGLWYQITHNNGLFETPGGEAPGIKGAMAAGTVREAAGVVSGTLSSIPWRLMMVLLSVGIAAAATLSMCVLGNFHIFQGLLWAAAATGAVGYMWRGNYSREGGGDIKEQLPGLAASAAPVFIVCMLLWLPYYISFYSRFMGIRGVGYGFMRAFAHTLLYLIPVVTLGLLWKRNLPSLLLYRPSKEDMNQMLMGAAISGGAMAAVHVVSLLGGRLFLHRYFSSRTVAFLFCSLVADGVTAAVMAYVWGRRGIYKAGSEDQDPAFPLGAGETPAGQSAPAKASPLQNIPLFNAGFTDMARQTVQTSKFRRKTNVGIVRAENTQEYWREGAPLALTQMTLTEQAGQLSLILGLQNLGQEIINAIYVDIDCYNVLKEKIACLKDVSFLDLKVGRGSIFFNNLPVQLPDATVRQCEICLRHAVFADESIWNGEEGRFLEKLAPQKYLAEEDVLGPELADEYCRLMAASRGKGLADMKRLYLYAPEQREGYWYCSCGQINLSGGDVCMACGSGREEIFAMAEPELLKRAREDRLAEERRRMEEEERLKAERIAERNRKIEETKAAAKKKAQELVSHGKSCYEKGSEKVQGYVSGIGAGKDSRTAQEQGPAQPAPGTPPPAPGTPPSAPGTPPPTPGTPPPAPGTPPPAPGTPSPTPGTPPSAPGTPPSMPGTPPPTPGTPSPTPGTPSPTPGTPPSAPEIPPQPTTSKRPCPSCGVMCGGEELFCMNCGASLKQAASQNKICPGCGRENSAAARFCTGCGAKLGE